MTVRETIAQAHRVVVKIGSSSLTGIDGQLDEAALGALVDVLASMRAAGREVILVTSGSIAAGIGPLGLPSRPRELSTAQATASVGQGMLIAAYSRAFGAHGLHVGQVLLTADDMVRRTHYGNAQRALDRLLELGVVPIVNENDTVATDEIRFGDNDRLAALVATVVRADALVLLTDVDGLYTAAPDTPGARRIDVVAGPEDVAGVDISKRGSALGTGGMVTKLEAATIATSSGVVTVLTSAPSVAAAVSGDSVGTLFLPTGKRAGTRLTWLAHAARMEGQLLLDSGAAHAVEGRRASLLAAGVRAVRGEFDAGDPVELVSPTGVVVARGLSGFASHEIPQMLGQTTDQLRNDLGEHFARPLVHIDDLIVTVP
ncbi:glutamate 5-kinase [Demequina sp. B12]|uniref:glutamate 5-kinase n=1 Tax=Demequina sp. B12 TaxID=2992757 RepID=UPI00237C384B|nr:glutamate 5-kinase [Demequina sp. B12]MDE0572789.1 glutamate 5-kinase [Demequina sp. B12]